MDQLAHKQMKLRLELTDGEHTTGRTIILKEDGLDGLRIQLRVCAMKHELNESKQSTKSVSLTQVGTVHGELPGE